MLNSPEVINSSADFIISSISKGKVIPVQAVEAPGVARG
jgi:hypothetical protein